MTQKNDQYERCKLALCVLICSASLGVIVEGNVSNEKMTYYVSLSYDTMTSYINPLPVAWTSRFQSV